MLSWISLFQLAVSNIKIHKFRCALTILGMTFGTGAVIATLSSNEGAAQYIKRELAKLGTNIVGVVAKPRNPSPLSEKDRLHLANYAYLLKSVSFVTSVHGAKGIYAGKAVNLSAFGVQPTYLRDAQLALSSGRNFDSVENEQMASLAVIGARTRKELFGDKTAIGESIHLTIEDRTFSVRVIGILKEKGGAQGEMVDRGIYLPQLLAEKLATQGNTFHFISAILKDENQAEEAKNQILTLLHPHFPEGIVVNDAREAIERTKSIWGKQNLVGICLALISLLTGGVGIMNIMLLSVTQRKKEIGLRKAVGATDFHILIQFLLESVTVCLLGGITGVLAGMMFGQQVAQMMGQWDAVISIWSIILALGFAVLTGVIFGLAPAYRASKMEPYEALRA